MAVPGADWAEQVRAAVIAGDEAVLRDLFARGRDLFGSDVGQRWAEAVSGLDASAQTG